MGKPIVFGLLVIVVNLSLCNEQTVAQDRGHGQQTNMYWAEAGLGFITMNNPGSVGLSVLLSAAYCWDHSSLSASIQGGGTFSFWGTEDQASFIDLCYGRLIFNGPWIFRFGVGPAYLRRSQTSSGLFSGPHTNFAFSQPGISTEIKALYHSSTSGVAVTLKGALSKDITLGTLLVSFTLGSFE